MSIREFWVVIDRTYHLVHWYRAVRNGNKAYDNAEYVVPFPVSIHAITYLLGLHTLLSYFSAYILHASDPSSA